MDIYQFPKNFLWGSATASYQVEGAVKEDGRGETIWDRYCKCPGRIKNGDTGEIACDHYHRYKEDVQLMKQLGLGSYRFSIAWSRILPEGTGKVSEEGIQFYVDLVDELLKAGIEPCVTLYHWDLPQAMQDIGGWANPKMADYFLEYSKIVFEKLGSRVRKWITLNEPYCVAFLGNFEGRQAPGIQDFSTALQVAYHLYLAHGKTVKYFRESQMAGEIGITLNLMPRHAYPKSEENEQARVWADGYLNRWFLDPLIFKRYPEDMIELYRKKQIKIPDFDKKSMEIIGQDLDFLGINYYNDQFVKRNETCWPLETEPVIPPELQVTDREWPITPDGLEEMLIRLKTEYGVKKIYITENGASFQDVVTEEHTVEDAARKEYLRKHLKAVYRAIQKGVPVKGYYVWSLLDNFEWGFGYTSRFGIIYVDFHTQERIVKASGKWFAKCIAMNGIRED
ncbi:MAG: GH1 family beta-glucosidase [Hespellia sp.]|nr:GH1 family beta-glucosidase [Hespellia sp.]